MLSALSGRFTRAARRVDGPQAEYAGTSSTEGLHVAMEAATYHRIRTAVSAAHKSGTVTVLSGSTELSLPAASEYASNFMALEGIRDVRVSIGIGSLEIGPEQASASEKPAASAPTDRRRADRRSGVDRRKTPRNNKTWE